MKKVSDLCDERRVVVRGIFGETTVKAWHRGGWAAHRQIAEPMMWCLTLLPLGLSLPLVWASFLSLGDAVSAMCAIVRMRNDWHRITQADLTKELEGRLKEICRRHGAIKGPMQMGVSADLGVTGRPLQGRFNGYGILNPMAR